MSNIYWVINLLKIIEFWQKAIHSCFFSNLIQALDDDKKEWFNGNKNLLMELKVS